MEILFDKNHPKGLIDALQSIQDMDSNDLHTVSFYDSSTKDADLTNPILLRIDRKKKGVEPVTEVLFENGFRVFALKFPPAHNIDCFDLSITVLTLWPKALKLLREKESPFIYIYKSDKEKLVKIKD